MMHKKFVALILALSSIPCYSTGPNHNPVNFDSNATAVNPTRDLQAARLDNMINHINPPIRPGNERSPFGLPSNRTNTNEYRKHRNTTLPDSTTPTINTSTLNRMLGRRQITDFNRAHDNLKSAAQRAARSIEINGANDLEAIYELENAKTNYINAASKTGVLLTREELNNQAEALIRQHLILTK